MKLLIIRHGEPDYAKDSLTEKGWREASFLSERLLKEKIDYVYASPLGRAQDTAKEYIEKSGKSYEVKAWLREFDEKRILRPDRNGERMIAWDWLPQDWTRVPEFYDFDLWKNNDIMREAEIPQLYDRVGEGLFELLAEHGYTREGNIFKAEKSNDDTIALFCHFGLECVILSHLLRVSPMILWHGFVAAPSSVTTVVTEERRRGTAIFRISSYGDVSHLYHHGEESSFAARFAEIYGNGDRLD